MIKKLKNTRKTKKSRLIIAFVSVCFLLSQQLVLHAQAQQVIQIQEIPDNCSNSANYPPGAYEFGSSADLADESLFPLGDCWHSNELAAALHADSTTNPRTLSNCTTYVEPVSCPPGETLTDVIFTHTHAMMDRCQDVRQQGEQYPDYRCYGNWQTCTDPHNNSHNENHQHTFKVCVPSSQRCDDPGIDCCDAQGDPANGTPHQSCYGVDNLNPCWDYQLGTYNSNDACHECEVFEAPAAGQTFQECTKQVVSSNINAPGVMTTTIGGQTVYYYDTYPADGNGSYDAALPSTDPTINPNAKLDSNTGLYYSDDDNDNVWDKTANGDPTDEPEIVVEMIGDTLVPPSGPGLGNGTSDAATGIQEGETSQSVCPDCSYGDAFRYQQCITFSPCATSPNTAPATPSPVTPAIPVIDYGGGGICTGDNSAFSDITFTMEGYNIRWAADAPNILARLPVPFESAGYGYKHEDFVFMSQVRELGFPYLEPTIPFTESQFVLPPTAPSNLSGRQRFDTSSAAAYPYLDLESATPAGINLNPNPYKTIQRGADPFVYETIQLDNSTPPAPISASVTDAAAGNIITLRSAEPRDRGNIRNEYARGRLEQENTDYFLLLAELKVVEFNLARLKQTPPQPMLSPVERSHIRAVIRKEVLSRLVTSTLYSVDHLLGEVFNNNTIDNLKERYKNDIDITNLLNALKTANSNTTTPPAADSNARLAAWDNFSSNPSLSNDNKRRALIAQRTLLGLMTQRRGINSGNLSGDADVLNTQDWQYGQGLRAASLGFRDHSDPTGPTRDEPNLRSQEAIVGARGCDIGGWYELMLYQLRCIQWFKLNCICDYEKTFMIGSAESYVLTAAGASFDAIRPYIDDSSGKEEIRMQQSTIVWPLMWKGSAGPYYGMWQSTSNTWSAHRPEHVPNSTTASLNTPSISLSPRLWDRNNEGVSSAANDDVFANATNDDTFIGSADVILREAYGKPRSYLSTVQANAGTGEYSGKYYVDHSYRGLSEAQPGDFMIYDETIRQPTSPGVTAGARYSPTLIQDSPGSLVDARYRRHIALVQKVNRNSQSDTIQSITVSEYNWGKNLDSCGNTDRWGTLTFREILRPDGPLADTSEKPEANYYGSCDDPDYKICIEHNWYRIKLFRPSYDHKDQANDSFSEVRPVCEIYDLNASGDTQLDTAICPSSLTIDGNSISLHTSGSDPLVPRTDVPVQMSKWRSLCYLNNWFTNLSTLSADPVTDGFFKDSTCYGTFTFDANTDLGADNLAKIQECMTPKGIIESGMWRLTGSSEAINRYDADEVEAFLFDSAGVGVGRCDPPLEMRNRAFQAKNSTINIPGLGDLGIARDFSGGVLPQFQTGLRACAHPCDASDCVGFTAQRCPSTPICDGSNYCEATCPEFNDFMCACTANNSEDTCNCQLAGTPASVCTEMCELTVGVQTVPPYTSCACVTQNPTNYMTACERAPASIICTNPCSSPSCSGYSVTLCTPACAADPCSNTNCPGWTSECPPIVPTMGCVNPCSNPSCIGYNTTLCTPACQTHQCSNSSCPGYDAAFCQACAADQCSNQDCPGWTSECPPIVPTMGCVNPCSNPSCIDYNTTLCTPACVADRCNSTACPGYTTAPSC